MILASAQTKPKQGKIKENLLDHYKMIERASDSGADLIVFPETSMTGYERENADLLAFSPDDSRLDHLIKLSGDKNITIIAGAPIKIKSDLYIGSFIIQPDNSVKIYTKQFLHLGEEVYYKPSFDYNPIIKLDNERISLAICFDIENQIHPKNASKNECTLYIPSIFFTPNGISEAHNLLSSYAKKYSMSVLMSNFCAKSWNIAAGGRSAFWNRDGHLIAAMNDSNAGLILVENCNDIWSGQIINDKETGL